jgi:tRNA A-37 threonylcarbamoyl transferase component Bud32
MREFNYFQKGGNRILNKLSSNTRTVFDKFHWYFFMSLYKLSRFLTDKFELRTYKHRKEIWLSNEFNGYKLSIDEVGFQRSSITTFNKKLLDERNIHIGEIDQDGFIFQYYDLFKGAPVISRENFMERVKHKIYLVIHDGYIGIEKRFKNHQRFLNEFVALANLSNKGINVPAILDVDFDSLTITVSYIHGKVLREELANKGAVLRDSQLGYMKDCSDKNMYKKKIVEEGLKVMHHVIDMQYIGNIHRQISKIHEAGFLIGDIKYGNIIIEEKSGEPFIIDFEVSRQLSKIKSQRVREILKQRDIDKFKYIFGLAD